MIPTAMSDDTCWTVIEAAARGDRDARERFARAYESPVRRYLAARWSGHALRHDLDDAVQDVFVECFRDGGALSRHDGGRARDFRGFLYGVARNVARRRESRDAATRARRDEHSPETLDLPDGHDPASRVFDREWARGVMRAAAERQRAESEAAGEGARRRVELLRLRFEEGLPIREVAARWDVEPAGLHHEYARARREFAAALRAVVAEQLEERGGARGEAVDRECAALLELLR